jgi:phosphoribosylamine--glycine ligase
MNKRILVVGSGGREHALGWKLNQSPNVEKILYAPGNGGTENNLSIKPTDIDGLLKLAKDENCFTVVGPEVPLGEGIVDRFQEKELPIFGPDKQASQLELSKVFSKKFMQNHGISTANFRVFQNPDDALEYIKSKELPMVIKADGLAAGKGAIICRTLDEARIAIDRVMIKQEFGSAGNRVIVEDFLHGFEVSFIGIADGINFIPFATSQDHKQVYDGDLGANTGGMGAYSPVPMVSDELYEMILNKIMKKTVNGMRQEGREIKGVLYAGIMICNGIPYVLEFNCRFGDPETQPQLFRMKSDLVPYLEASAEGNLQSLDPIKWESGSAVCVVMASGGYPNAYERGKVIHGLNDAMKMKDIMVFHAGTENQGESIVTSGGRVLGITALGRDTQDAVERVYKALKLIRFEGAHHRKDIGNQALGYLGGL